MNPKLVEEVARAMCFQDSPSHVWHCDPDALKEPPNWKRGASGDLDERMTNWEVRAYMARAAIRVCAPHFAKIALNHEASAEDYDGTYRDGCEAAADAIKREGGVT